MGALKILITLFYYLILWPFVSVKVHWTRYDQANYKDPKRILFSKLITENDGDFQKRLSARGDIIDQNKLSKDQIREIGEKDYAGYINWKKIMRQKKRG